MTISIWYYSTVEKKKEGTEMGITHTEYVFMTLKSKQLRIAVGNRKGTASIVYTYSLDPDLEEAFYSHRVFLNALTEEEGAYLQQLVEERQTRKANAYVLKTMRQEQCLGPCGPVVLSDLIPDEWFDGCKHVMSLLSWPKITGVVPMDIEDYNDIFLAPGEEDEEEDEEEEEETVLLP